jgi:hypothetical protein
LVPQHTRCRPHVLRRRSVRKLRGLHGRQRHVLYVPRRHLPQQRPVPACEGKRRLVLCQQSVRVQHLQCERLLRLRKLRSLHGWQRYVLCVPRWHLPQWGPVLCYQVKWHHMLREHRVHVRNVHRRRLLPVRQLRHVYYGRVHLVPGLTLAASRGDVQHVDAHVLADPVSYGYHHGHAICHQFCDVVAIQIQDDKRHHHFFEHHDRDQEPDRGVGI